MSDHERPDEEAAGRFARQAGQILRRGSEELDAATLSRLNRARQNALAELDRRRGRPIWLASWRPAMGMAAAAALVLGLWLAREPAPGVQALAPDPSQLIAGSTADSLDFELLLADESLDMLAELEFYDWLAAQADAEAGLDPGLSG